MSLIRIDLTDLETVLKFRMTFSEPPRSREAALSPGDTAPEAVHFGAYLNGELVGVCSIGPEPLPVLSHPDAWRFRGLIVLPNFRNRGIAPALLQHQLKEVAARPNPLAWSYVKRKNVPFFSHYGYRPSGYTYEHPVAGETVLCGNEPTLRLIQRCTGITDDDGEPTLGTVDA